MAYGRIRKDDWSKQQGVRIMLRAARREKNLSIPELAKLSHWSSSYIGEAEKGTCEMSVRLAKDLARVLMVNKWEELIEKFIYYDDEKGKRFIGDNGTIIKINETFEEESE